MKGVTQQQQTVQIAGVIKNFKTVTTRTGKPMAIFTVGNIPAKCFDLTVSNAEAWACMGTEIVVTGHFSSHQGKAELVADGIAPVAPGTSHDDGIEAVLPTKDEEQDSLTCKARFASTLRGAIKMTNNLATTTATTSCVPTGDEWTVLVKHWVNEAIDDQYFIFWGQCVGNSDLRSIDFDWQRVDEIAQILGSEESDRAIVEAYEEAAQRYERCDWVVFRYGNEQERRSYQDRGGQAFLDFKCGEAEEIAGNVMQRVFRDGMPEQQQALLKGELARYAKKLSSYQAKPGHIVEIFGIYFPRELRPFIVSAGIVDPSPNSGPDTNIDFGTPTIKQGEALLVMLDETARKGEDALRALVVSGQHGEEGYVNPSTR